MSEVNNKPLLGVIGGLGPAATAYFMKLVISMTEINKEQEHLDMLVYSRPSIPDRTSFILDSSHDSPAPQLIYSAKQLVNQKVSCLVMPCITAHYFYDEIQSSITVPLINGIKETISALQRKEIRTVGLLATDGTLKASLFTKELIRTGIEPVFPSSKYQNQLMSIIYNIKAGTAIDYTSFEDICKDLIFRRAENIILGCTELSLIKERFPLRQEFTDVLEIMAQTSILRCGKKLKTR